LQARASLAKHYLGFQKFGVSKLPALPKKVKAKRKKTRKRILFNLSQKSFTSVIFFIKGCKAWKK